MAGDRSKTQGKIAIPGQLAVVPLRNSVLFPGSLIPIDVARSRSRAALDRAGDGVIALVTQREKDDDGPEMKLFDVGCAVRILKIIKLAKDNFSVILHGLQRIRILDLDRTGECFLARVEPIAEPDGFDDEILLRKADTLKAEAKRMIALMPELPKEATGLVEGIAHPGELADVLASHLDLSVDDKQQLLETVPLAQRVDLVLAHIKRAAAALAAGA